MHRKSAASSLDRRRWLRRSAGRGAAQGARGDDSPLGGVDRLVPGAEVAVAGAGPGGCAFAIALLTAAAARGSRLGVRLFDVPDATTALPPCIVGGLARHQLSALGVTLSPESCPIALERVRVWARDRVEVLALSPQSAWVVDGWPAQAPGLVGITQRLQQSAAMRGARFVPRPIDDAVPHPDGLQLRAGGGPQRAAFLAVSRPLSLPSLRLRAPPTRPVVRGRLFASPEACRAFDATLGVFVRPTPGVSLLIAIPGASSLHLSAYGPNVSASELGLAMAELRRRGELPWGLEMAELARAQVGWGLGRPLRLPGALSLGDALGASPLDPLSQALEQGQRAAVALIEAADDLGTLPSRLEGLLAFPLADVSHARVALARMTRAHAGTPKALALAHARAPLHGGGLFFGVGPLAHEARRALWRPSVTGPVSGLWRDQGPGRPAPSAPTRPIYVVDDDPSQRALLCEFLVGRGLAVRAVGDELGLLAAAAEEPRARCCSTWCCTGWTACGSAARCGGTPPPARPRCSSSRG